LEQRTNALGGDVATTGSLRPAHNALPTPAPAERLIKASPINDTVIFTAPPDREARLESRELPASKTRITSRGDADGLDGILGRISGAIDKVDRQQIAVLTDMEERMDSKARRMRSVLSDLGVDPAKAPAGAGLGGPFVPLKPPHSGASAFDRQLYRINVARAEINQYSHTLVSVPVRKPVTGEVDMSSPFGMRLDPFLGRPAIHTGIDLRGEIGEPVHATGAGRVTIAGRDGGYGNMVEISHGNGLATRYGHLSQIDVKVGQTVRVGEIIGKIGSTGRSTGPHLHYETRVNGEAVDPQKFLRAGVRLGSALSG
jgi:murein DD-endopeptidase MepM/ murein hydrolase activator NlpD